MRRWPACLAPRQHAQSDREPRTLPPTDDDAEAAATEAGSERQVKQGVPKSCARIGTPSATGSPNLRWPVCHDSRRAPAPSVCATPRPSSYAAGAATTARAAPIGSAAPTRPRPAAAAAEDGAAENDLSAVASAAFGVPPASSRTGKVVEATNVSIARRAVPAISWTGDRASSRGDAHARLAAFEGRFGAPERMQDYNEADGSAEASEPTPVCIRNAWPSSTRSRRGSKRGARRAECIVCARMRTCRRYNILYKPSLSFQLNRANTYRTY